VDKKVMGDYKINPNDIELLRKQGMSEEDIDHSIGVAEKALKIGRLVKKEVIWNLSAGEHCSMTSAKP
jgi:hypothetical protein